MADYKKIMGTPENESVKEILIRRDSLSPREADEIIAQARARILDGEDPEEVCYDELGLEPDYVLEIIGW